MERALKGGGRVVQMINDRQAALLIGAPVVQAHERWRERDIRKETRWPSTSSLGGGHVEGKTETSGWVMVMRGH